MRLSIKGKNGAFPDALKSLAEKKISKLERFFHGQINANLEQYSERGQHIVELNLEGDGLLLRSEDRSNDLHAAVDTVVNKMERQVKRFKTKQRHGHQRPGPVKEVVAEQVSADLVDGEEPYVPRIVRRKRFPMKPMPAE